MKKNTMHALIYTVLLSLPLLVMPLFIRLTLWPESVLIGGVSDLLAASCFYLVIFRRSSITTLLLLLFWIVLQIANYELLTAVERMPALQDVGYLFDRQFLEGSAGLGAFAYPQYAAIFLLSLSVAFFYRVYLRSQPFSSTPKISYAIPILCFVVYQGLANQSTAPQHQQFNIAHKLLGESIANLQQVVRDQISDEDATKVNISNLTKLDLNAKRLIATGQARNVLVVMLEGIPGAYIEKNVQALAINYNKRFMPKLSKATESGMHIPDYVVHSHQTIRGMYSLLCGDYSKLNNGTPKGIELLALEEQNQLCLPAQLAKHGFRTHYLQGAGMVFMSKDKIMPHIGFEQVHGREWFKDPSALKFSWGADDKTFFEGASTYVEQLQKTKEPWMLTLLTVGTHQPYVAPQSYLDQYGSPKAAAVAYLDDAVGQFITQLKTSGVLDNTLVIITSDESHGVDDFKMGSSWGLNIVLAPEQQQLPAIKTGTFGHVDFTASVLDYFNFKVPDTLSGRSFFRDYTQAREMISYTSGYIRYLDKEGIMHECNFQQQCFRFKTQGYISAVYEPLANADETTSLQVFEKARLLDQSLAQANAPQSYTFAKDQRHPLSADLQSPWENNLIGAQYLEFAPGSRTTVHLSVKALSTDQRGAHLVLLLKEFDVDSADKAPEIPILNQGQSAEISFSIDNPKGRKAFSFHLLGEGKGEIEINNFSLRTELL